MNLPAIALPHQSRRKKKHLNQLLYTLATHQHFTMSSPVRTTILISGSGTNLQAVIDRVHAGELNAQIIRVLSNRKDAYGLERARKASIPTEYHNLVKYKKAHPATPEGVQAAREEYDAELARLILADQPELVVCLGFMHILSPQFLSPLEKANVRIINLHPALPGAFNGVVSFPSKKEKMFSRLPWII